MQPRTAINTHDSCCDSFRYDTSDGWFVIDDSELFSHSPDSKKSPRLRAGDPGGNSAGIAGPGGDGTDSGHSRRSASSNRNGDSHGGDDNDDDDSMFHSTIDRTRTSGARSTGENQRLRVSGAQVGRRLPFSDGTDDGDVGGLDIDDAMYHSATEIDPATLPTNFDNDVAQNSAAGGGGGGGGVSTSPESTPGAAQHGGTDSASVGSVVPASGLGDLVDSVYFDANDVDAPAVLQPSAERAQGHRNSAVEEVDVLSSSQASSLASSYSSASSEPRQEHHVASANGVESRVNASLVIPIVVESTQPSAPRPSLSSSPHSSVGSPPGPKARIEAEIRMLEQIMKKNRPS